jgi:hypothetical protein
MRGGPPRGIVSAGMKELLELAAVGCVAALLVLRLPARGSWALGFAAVPLLGFGLTALFC